MDEFTRIQTFIKVVEAGSFSAVARKESSVSSVARQVKALEDSLGIRLLNRSTRSLSLTEPGRMFYERVCSVSRDLNNAKSEVKTFQDSVKGVLRVQLRASAASTFIIPALPKLLSRYPELRLDVSVSDERCDLVASNIDVAVWMGEMPNSELVARRLAPCRRIVCGSPAYFEQHGTPQMPEALKQHQCLLYSARSYGNNWIFSKNGNTSEIEVQGPLRTADGLVLLSAAQAGLGLIIVHEWMVRLPIAEGRLVRILEDHIVSPTSTTAELYAVYPSKRGLSRNVRAFVDFLVELFQGD
jgi:DNA-binding transcriptional LysR family regulator